MKFVERVIIVILLAAAMSGLWYAFAGREKEYNGVFVRGHIYQTVKESKHGGLYASIN